MVEQETLITQNTINYLDANPSGLTSEERQIIAMEVSNRADRCMSQLQQASELYQIYGSLRSNQMMSFRKQVRSSSIAASMQGSSINTERRRKRCNKS